MTTRPVNDTKKPPVPVPTRPVAGAGAPTAASAAAEVGSVAKVSTERAVSVDLSVTSQVRSDTLRMDTERLQALKKAVANGTYEVDAKALAGRIVEDSLGPEVLD